MSKYEFTVSPDWHDGKTGSLRITRSDFAELQNILSKISNSIFKFTFYSGGPSSMEVIPDPEPDPIVKLLEGPKFITAELSSAAKRETRLQVLEMRIERILTQAEDLKSEIKCIRKGD